MAGTFSPADLVTLIDRIRAEGAVSTAALRLAKLDEAARESTLLALGAAGLEVNEKGARVPLTQQLTARVRAAGDRGVAMATAQKALKGARAPAEKRAAVESAVAAGTIAVAIEEGEVRLVAMSDAVLSHAELDRLPGIVASLKRLIQQTKAKPGKLRPTILRARWLATLAVDAVGEALGPSRPSPLPTALLAALVAAPAPMGLVRVPEVVAALETIYDRGALVAALDTLAREGALELRPESGLQQMSDADRARCPIGFDGTPLSYARLRADEEKSS